MTPAKIRKIRKVMGMSQQDFSRFLWVTYSTLSRWELGYATPFGLHLRILTQLEKQLTSPTLRLALRDPKSEDFTFLLYRLLKLSYWRRAGRAVRSVKVLERQREVEKQKYSHQNYE
jgi:transcriptional regulator with XRE-family HTH domain